MIKQNKKRVPGSNGRKAQDKAEDKDRGQGAQGNTDWTSAPRRPIWSPKTQLSETTLSSSPPNLLFLPLLSLWRSAMQPCRASLVAQLVKNPFAMWVSGFDPWIEIPWRRERLPTPVFWSGELHELYSPAAAAAAKSLQSSPDSVRPHRQQPSRLPRILQARISFTNTWKWKVKVKSLSHVQLLATPWTAAYQAPPSMGFSRQEYWSGVPLPPPTV